jgi:hypothetical protein
MGDDRRRDDKATRRVALLLGVLFASGTGLGCEAEPEPPPVDDGADGIFITPPSGGTDAEEGSGTRDDPYRGLAIAIERAGDGDTLFLAPGSYEAEPSDDVDPTCGNCDDADFFADIPISVGFVVRDKGLHLVGESRADTVLVTHAGYGVYFDHAGASSVRNLTITGGVRDADGRATDAAIVARFTALEVIDVDIIDNDALYAGEPDPVVGVMGITGREGAQLYVEGCRIENTSWDGVALYRSDPMVPDSAPRAHLVSNVIGCTRDCVYQAGRGVGVGATWDSELLAVNNTVHHFWKGIGAMGASRVELYNNVVVDQHGWGVVATGTSSATVVNNVIARNGTTGLAAWSSTLSGRFANNVVTGNGWNTDEWVGKRTGVWMNSSTVELTYNDIWDNAPEDVCTGGVPGDSPCDPVTFLDDNLSVDPKFDGEEPFHLLPGSPLINAGDPDVEDGDGSRSDIGLHGGPHAL